jgi:hypothetical protein
MKAANSDKLEKLKARDAKIQARIDKLKAANEKLRAKRKAYMSRLEKKLMRQTVVKMFSEVLAKVKP